MNCTELTPPEVDWLERIRFYISRCPANQDYGLFLQHLSVRSRNEHDYSFIAAIGMVEDQFTLFLNFPIMTKLPVAVAAEILVHEVLHPICGHCGPRGTKLFEKYGKEIGGIAVDLVVNQYISLQLLIDANLSPVSFDMEVQLKTGVASLKSLGFVPNCTAEEYAAKLAALDYFKLPVDPRFEEFENTLRAPAADALIQEVIERVREAAQANNTTLNPGFSSPDALEYIAQRKGTAQITWQQHLRRLYTASLYSRREPTPSRPSRRCEWHQGRVTRQDIYIWFVVDTSGSMGVTELSLVERELQTLRKLGARIHILHCDVKVAKEFDYNGGSLESFAGRGGTDFSPVFIKLAELGRHERPNMVIFYTDGQGGYAAYDKYMLTKHPKDWPAFLRRHARCTFERIPLLWLIPDSSYLHENKNFLGFGEVAVLQTKERQVVH